MSDYQSLQGTEGVPQAAVGIKERMSASTNTESTLKMVATTQKMMRKIERKQRAVQAATKEPRLGHKGRKHERKLTRQQQPHVECAMPQDPAVIVQAAPKAPLLRKRSDKLAHQLASLVAKDASWGKLLNASEKLDKAKYREKRVADMGRNTAPRSLRRQEAIAA